MPGNLTLDELRRLVEGGEVDTVLVVFPDMQGRLMGKRVTGSFFLGQVARGGMHACAYLLTVDVDMEPLAGYRLASWDTGYQDMHAVPDWATLRRVPWLDRTAMVLCDVEDARHAPIAVAPRQVLRRQVERAAAAGYRVLVASELEFYLFRDSFETARRKHYLDLEPIGAYIEDYHILQTTKEEFVVRDIRNAMAGAGIVVESSKGEWGHGQEELNLTYGEPLPVADDHVIYKNGAKEIAHQKGVALTFMAKYDMRQAGSSFHLHSSLWDAAGTRNLFHDPTSATGSALFRHWVAGQLALARELAWFYAPYVNSYKRYQAGSFAPTRIAWAWDNRTTGFRMCGSDQSLRIENRIPGADANPYLAFAATIAAGLYGIERRLEPPPLYQGNAYADPTLPQVPRALRDAVVELERSEVGRAAFGDDVWDHYLHTARLELEAADKVVTHWELERNFERI
ncbi:MAG: glutamine synthetase family protein [Candidatus Binatia bacterium]